MAENLKGILDKITYEIGNLNTISTIDDIKNIKENIKNSGASSEDKKILGELLEKKLDKLAGDKPFIEFEKWSNVEKVTNTTNEKEQNDKKTNYKPIQELESKIKQATTKKQLEDLWNIVNRIEDKSIRSSLYKLINQKEIEVNKDTTNKKIKKVFLTTLGAVLIVAGLGKLVKQNTYISTPNNTTTVDDKSGNKSIGKNYSFINYDYDRTPYTFDNQTNPFSTQSNIDINDTLYGNFSGTVGNGEMANGLSISSENKIKDSLDKVNNKIAAKGWKRIDINSIDQNKRFDLANQFNDLTYDTKGSAGKYLDKFDNPIDIYNCMTDALYYSRLSINFDGTIGKYNNNGYGMDYWLKLNNIDQDLFKYYDWQRYIIRTNMDILFNKYGINASYSDYLDKYYYDSRFNSSNRLSKNLYKEIDEVRATLFYQFYKEEGLGDYYYMLLPIDEVQKILEDGESNCTTYIPYKDRPISKTYKVN